MDMLLSIIVGLGLAAACGFRVFVPLAILSLGVRADMVALGSGWEWLGSDAALIALGTASGLEIAAYWVPWLDNLLDTVATPAAVVAGSIVAASQMASLDPMLQWSCAVIVGGGVAGVVQIASVATRAASTALTGGIANPVVSTGETALAGVVTLGALASPVIALVALAFIGFVVYRILRIAYGRVKARRQAFRAPAAIAA